MPNWSDTRRWPRRSGDSISVPAAPWLRSRPSSGSASVTRSRASPRKCTPLPVPHTSDPWRAVPATWTPCWTSDPSVRTLAPTWSTHRWSPTLTTTPATTHRMSLLRGDCPATWPPHPRQFCASDSQKSQVSLGRGLIKATRAWRFPGSGLIALRYSLLVRSLLFTFGSQAITLVGGYWQFSFWFYSKGYSIVPLLDP